MRNITTINTSNSELIGRILGCEIEESTQEQLGGVLIVEQKYTDLISHLRDNGVTVFDYSMLDEKPANSGFNPFESADAATCAEIITNLTEIVGGIGAIWRGRATMMFAGLMKALCWFRDNNHLELNAATIRDHLSIETIVDLASDGRLQRIPADISADIRTYLSALPGFDFEKGAQQPQATLDCHEYLETIFARTMSAIEHYHGSAVVERNLSKAMENGETVAVVVRNTERGDWDYDVAVPKLIFTSFAANRKNRKDKRSVCCLTGFPYYARAHEGLIAETNAEFIFALEEEKFGGINTHLGTFRTAP